MPKPSRKPAAPLTTHHRTDQAQARAQARAQDQGQDQGQDHAPHIAVVMSTYNESITLPLCIAAIAECVDRTGFTPAVFQAPGAYELPGLCMAAAKTGRYDGIVALGCIIKGETTHDQHIAQAIAHGLTNVTLLTDIPVALGVLTTNNAAQARARAGGNKGNKGQEAMAAVLDTLQTLRLIDDPSDSTPTGVIAAKKPDKAASRPAPRTKRSGARA